MKRLDALLLVLFAAALVVAARLRPAIPWGQDALAYRPDLADPYAAPMNTLGAYLYSPAFAQLMAPLRALPPDVYLALWTAMLVAVLWTMGHGRAALLFCLPIVAIDVLTGNVHLLIAASVVVGFRHPSAWAFVLLTKVTPAVGLAWFVARRDWHSLMVAGGMTAGIVAASFVLAPDLWAQWVGRLTSEASRTEPGAWAPYVGPLWLRVAAAAGIAAAGGVMGLRWPVPVAVALAVPNPSPGSLALLVALVPLIRMDRRDPLPAMLRLSRGSSPGLIVRSQPNP